MKISMDVLMTMIPRAEDRARMTDLAEQYRTGRAEGVVDCVLDELDKHWRAIRRPKPSREEVVEMLLEVGEER